MIRTILAVAVLVAAVSMPAGAQTTAEVRELEALPARFSEAWVRHDAQALGALMADDVDFVTVGAGWLRGRRDFELYHGRLLTGRFRRSRLTPLEHRMRIVRPGLALVHWSWRMDDDAEPGGAVRPPRFGLMTMLAEKRAGRWLVVASQNTNGMPGRTPEDEGINFPIRLPDAPPAGQPPAPR